MRIIPGPSVQLGLDLQYPALRQIQGVVQLTGIHRRPPVIPSPALPTCWPPSPCARLSRARTTTEPPPHPVPSADDVPIPAAQVAPGQRDRRGTVPVFTANRSISLASSFAPAASPQLRRRHSPWPPHRHAKSASESAICTRQPCTATRPLSTRFEPVPRLRSFTTGSSRIPSDLARRTRPVWQYQAVPALSALLPALPGVSRIGLRSAPTRLLRQPGEKVSHLLRFPAPHGAPAPRGARFPCSARVRHGWGRAPSLPRGLRCLPRPGDLPDRRPPPSSGRSLFTPVPQSAPGCNRDEASARVHWRSPLPAFPSPVIPGRYRDPRAFPELRTRLSRTQPRTSGRERASGTARSHVTSIR